MDDTLVKNLARKLEKHIPNRIFLEMADIDKIKAQVPECVLSTIKGVVGNGGRRAITVKDAKNIDHVVFLDEH